MYKYLIIIVYFILAGSVAQNLDHAIQSFNEKNYRQAINILEQITNKETQNVDALYYLGLAYQKLLQHQQAITMFEKGMVLDRTDMRFPLALPESFDQLGLEKKAETMLLDLREQLPDNDYIQIKLAGLYFNLKEYPKAIAVYITLIKNDSNNALFYKQLGICYYSLEKWPEAIVNLIQAKQMNSNDLSVYIYLYTIYMKLEEANQALNSVNEGLRLQPDHLQLIRAKAEVLFKTGQYTTARDLYFHLYEQGDSSATMLKKLGICYFYNRQWPHALLSLTKSIEKDSSDAVVYYYLGLIYAELKNKNKAIENLEKSIAWSLPESLPDVYFELAKLYDESKQVKQSINTYNKILSIYPKRTAALMYLGSMYERYYDDAQTALEYYQRYLESEGGTPTKQTEYVQERIDKIKEKEFMKRR